MEKEYRAQKHTCIYSQMIFDRGAKTIQMQNNEAGLSPMLYKEIKMDQRAFIKLLEENMGECLMILVLAIVC